MPQPRRTRLTKLSIRESSGVDKPANHTQFGGDGWMVVKADGTRAVAKAMTTCTQPGCNLKVLDGAAKCAGGHAQEEPTKKGATVAEKTAEELTAELAKADQDKAALEARVAELEKAAGPAKEPTEAEALAKAVEAMPEAARAAFAKAQADAAEAQEVAKAERELRLEREAVAKMETLGQPDTFAPIYRAATEKLTPEQHAEYDRVLKAAAEQAKAADALTKRQGIHGADGPAAGSAYAQLVAKAAELRTAAEAAGNPMTEAVAIDKAAQLHPDLVAKHREETA